MADGAAARVARAGDGVSCDVDAAVGTPRRGEFQRARRRRTRGGALPPRPSPPPPPPPVWSGDAVSVRGAVGTRAPDRAADARRPLVLARRILTRLLRRSRVGAPEPGVARSTATAPSRGESARASIGVAGKCFERTSGSERLERRARRRTGREKRANPGGRVRAVLVTDCVWAGLGHTVASASASSARNTERRRRERRWRRGGERATRESEQEWSGMEEITEEVDPKACTCTTPRVVSPQAISGQTTVNSHGEGRGHEVKDSLFVDAAWTGCEGRRVSEIRSQVELNRTLMTVCCHGRTHMVSQ